VVDRSHILTRGCIDAILIQPASSAAFSLSALSCCQRIEFESRWQFAAAVATAKCEGVGSQVHVPDEWLLRRSGT
jgi:hypothetical protein